MIRIENILDELSRERPVFHSEADFEYALAWKIHEKYPDLKIRPEKRIDLKGSKTCPYFISPDFIIHKDNDTEIVAIETKYKTKKINIKVFGEEFDLKEHSTPNDNRYYFVKDIWRIESFLKEHPKGYGFAIFLTNDASYWNKESQRADHPDDEDFRIYESRVIEGQLKWKEGGRERQAIPLKGKYTLNWREYSNLKEYSDSTEKNMRFRYLLVEVAPGSNSQDALAQRD